MNLDTNRRFALVFGIVLPALQLWRSLCFGRVPTGLLDVPLEVDAYVLGGLLVGGAWASARWGWGRALLAAAWGFSCGIMYRTTFEQLADPSRRAGAQAMVLGFKTVLFAVAIIGFVGAVVGAKSGTLGAKRASEAKG